MTACTTPHCAPGSPRQAPICAPKTGRPRRLVCWWAYSILRRAMAERRSSAPHLTCASARRELVSWGAGRRHRRILAVDRAHAVLGSEQPAGSLGVALYTRSLAVLHGAER